VSITPIINSKTAKVTLDITANPKAEGQLIVVARPVAGPVSDKAPEELKQLVAALSTPIKVIGTPDDIEQAFADAVNEQASTRTSWASRAASLESQIATGAQADQKKAPQKATGQTATASPAQTTAQKAVEEVKAETQAVEQDDEIEL